jgi:hypothetical protein
LKRGLDKPVLGLKVMRTKEGAFHPNYRLESLHVFQKYQK